MGAPGGTLALVLGGPVHDALDALADAAAEGAREHGFDVVRARVGAEDDAVLTELALNADALLLGSPIVFGGWPGRMKTWLDSWLELLDAGRLTPRTGGMRAGYLATYRPDDPAIPDSFDAAFRVFASFLGFDFRGKLARFARGPATERELAIAHRLGAVLAGDGGYAGYPDEYRRGVASFNDGEFWQAHEDWEELWLEAEGLHRVFLQGLIQVAAAMHHYGHQNWGGMLSLLRGGLEKLERCRPGMMGLDVDEFLEQLEPWRLLAEARAGHAPVVMRLPESAPRLTLES